MNSIKNAAEDLAVAVITNIRDILAPIINKYAAYYRYIQFFLYGTYALLLLGIYNTVPQYIPTLRSTILYVAVFILLLRFNTISWTNPKFAIIGGGSTFSEFDRRLIISTCVFILITHVISEAVVEYTKRQVQNKIIQPVSVVGGNVLQPLYGVAAGM